MMLTPRRIEIFKAIVDEFVQTAEPVGSKTLMEKYQIHQELLLFQKEQQYL